MNKEVKEKMKGLEPPQQWRANTDHARSMGGKCISWGISRKLVEMSGRHQEK